MFKQNLIFFVISLHQRNEYIFTKLIANAIMKTSKGPIQNIFRTENDNRALLVRLIVGLIFLTEGVQKYIFPVLLGTGRFNAIGFSHAAFWAYFTGAFEIICGTLIIIGLITRIAAVPLIIIMVTAFISTKLPVLIHKGFWPWAHEYRTDFAMTLLLVYLLIYGSGGWSVDSKYHDARKL
jgi:putative oxidoreductase